MLYDATCEFCCRWIGRWRILTGDSIDYLPFQTVTEQFPELTVFQLSKAVHFIDLDGRVCVGAEAVFRSLARTSPANRWMLWTYENVPLARRTIDRVYRWVARNRFNG